MRVLIVSDEKPGHRNQSIGLATAMQQRVDLEIQQIVLNTKLNFLHRIGDVWEQICHLGQFDYVIAAGHRTHLALFVISRKVGARSIVLMRPTLPAWCFDWCVVPEHDFSNRAAPNYVILSKGALNCVQPTAGERCGKWFIIGGPSKLHDYDEAALITQMKTLAGDGTGWSIADSRRTPESFRSALKENLPAADFFPHEATQAGFLAEKMSEAQTLKITEDSVSMVYEGLSSGAEVGLISMPCRRQNARVIAGLNTLKHEGYFSGAQPPLREAARCAEVILRSDGFLSASQNS